MAGSGRDTFVRLRLEPIGEPVPGIPEHAYRNCYVMVLDGTGLDDDTLVALAVTSLTDDCDTPIDVLLRDHRLETEIVSATTVRLRGARATNGLFHLPAAAPAFAHELDAVREALASCGTESPRP